MKKYPAITALVPMRHSSERVKNKNFRTFVDRPLFHHILASLQDCPEITRIVVDTDSPVIREQLAKNFPQISVLKRPEHLCAGDVPMNDVIANSLQQLEGEYFLQTHSTNPLLCAKTISSAVAQFFASQKQHDTLFSVTRLMSRLWDQNIKPINHNPALLLRTQDLPPVFEENSNLYIFSRSSFTAANNNRLGQNPGIFEIDKIEALDIDDNFDFILAEQIKIAQ